MVNIHTSHRMVLLLPAGMYVVLVLLVAVIPAQHEAQLESKMEKRYVSDIVARGRKVYQSLNCVACHTQQVRGNPRTYPPGLERISRPALSPCARSTER